MSNYFFTDTHSHLYLEQFKEDIDQVIDAAISNRVSRIYLPNIDSSTMAALNVLGNKNPAVFHMMMGLHPTSVKEDYKKELALVSQEFLSHKYCAVGEIGIDLYWDKTYLSQQVLAFEEQIELAISLNLPIIIHARDSFAEIFNSLKKFDKQKLRGIFHSFTGNVEQAHTALGLGEFVLGINGIVTFKNAGLDKTVQKIGLEHLVLETDAPFLAPTPNRGKRNESAYLVHIAQKISAIFGVSLEKVANITNKNSDKIFND